MQVLNERRKSKAWTLPELEPVAGSQWFMDARAPSRAPSDEIRVGPKADGHIKATTISFRTISQHGDLLVNFMEARKRVFIDNLHWSLPHTDGMEFDQYDTPQARWIVIHEFGQVLGGVRLTPTTAQCGIYTYMLRDAQKGLLSDIPTDVLFIDAPVLDNVWEASRLFITDEVPAQRRLTVQAALMGQMSATARGLGATHVIGIVPALFTRWLRRLDLDAVPVGRKFEIDGTRSQAALFNVTRISN